MDKRTGKANGKYVAVYCRVSSAGQKHDSQEHELRQYVQAHGLGNVLWFRDKASGANLDRPAFERLQADIFAGRVHTVFVWKLDRLARNLRDGVNVLADWCDKGIRLVSVTQQIDLSGAMGRVFAALLLGIGEIELNNIGERIRAGQVAARAKGKRIGRALGQRVKWSLSKRKVDPALARSLRAQGVAVRDIAAKFNCTRAGVYAALRAG